MGAPRTFPYTRVLGPSGFIWLALLRVELKTPAAEIAEWMVLDTGAEMTLIPWSTGCALGLTRRRRDAVDRMGRIGGTVPYLRRSLEIRWAGRRSMVRTAWAQTDDVPGLLGRLDFFDRMEICFDGRRRRFRIRAAARPD